MKKEIERITKNKRMMKILADNLMLDELLGHESNHVDFLNEQMRISYVEYSNELRDEFGEKYKSSQDQWIGSR